MVIGKVMRCECSLDYAKDGVYSGTGTDDSKVVDKASYKAGVRLLSKKGIERGKYRL